MKPRAERRRSESQSPDHDGLRRYQLFCRSYPMTEVAFPAKVLRDHGVARWARQHDVAVDVHTSEELGITIANGVRPARIVVHGDTLCDTELRCTTNLGVGRTIVGSGEQIAFLGGCTKGIRGVLIRMTDPAAPDINARYGFPFGAGEADNAMRQVLADNRLRLAGLHVRVGSDEHAYISCPAAIGNMIAEMARIRRAYGPVLTRLGIDCGIWDGDCGGGVRDLAAGIDDAVEDACAAMRFPRPRVLLTAAGSSLGSLAA
jgi:diaminopimelate decarboxylase